MCSSDLFDFCYTYLHGVLAQLGARNIRIVEATGSNPVYSILEALVLKVFYIALRKGNQQLFLIHCLSGTPGYCLKLLPSFHLFSYCVHKTGLNRLNKRQIEIIVPYFPAP